MDSIYRLYYRTAVVLIAVMAVIFTFPAGVSEAASAREINVGADVAIETLYREVGGSRELVKKGHGILIFPSIIKVGFGIGGEHGKGVLRVSGKNIGYYSTTAASIGFQIGVQKKSVVMIFMTKEALRNFRNSSGWEVGVDGSVAIIEEGVGGSIDTTSINSPIIGFIFGQKGLMINLTLEGSKLEKIAVDE